MALNNGAFLFLFTVLAWILSANASIETVWLKDLTTEFQREKRNLGDLDLPDELTFHLKRTSGDLTLNLKRNHGIDPNADIYMARTSRNGRPYLVKTRDMEKSEVAHYQDVENCAFMTVRCVKRSNDQCDRVINGNVLIRERNYDLQPESTDVTSRNVLVQHGRLEKRYILRDQAHMQRDTSIVNEKRIEQDFMGHFRRFKGQNKQNNVSPSDVKLSKSETVVYTRAAKDTIRAPTAVYTVKVAVLIDTGVWDLYSSMTHSSNPFTRSRKVKEKIRESFSHIMNGVDMRYKRIQDDSISITVILSRFVYFKSRSDFKFYNSEVSVVNGTEYVDGLNLLLDVLIWDQDLGKKLSPQFDNAMLFTRYKLYEKYLNDTFDGMTFREDVCNVGKRISVVRASDYLFTSLGAAHELGHSLGASHDGDEDATACSATDFYIMTPKEPAVHPSIPYPSNLWTFSRCSLEAFKRVLRTKDCVKVPGHFYDAQEYAKHIKQEPGEVYGLNHQCEVIIGPGSAYCWVVPLNMCYIMCTDPRTGRCRDRFYMAARGTKCGHNMWCIESKCVRKGK